MWLFKYLLLDKEIEVSLIIDKMKLIFMKADNLNMELSLKIQLDWKHLT